MTDRRSFGIHTDVNGMDLGLLKQSALVKVLFEKSEAAIVRGWKDIAHPYAYWLARTNIDQDNAQPLGELQQRYKAAATIDAARAVGVWYAEWIASWALPAGLDYFFWESGPNEEDDMSAKAPAYCEAFTRRCLELGLKPAAGMYSFGKPGVMKYNGYDGWLPWQPLFRLIERANTGRIPPIAGFAYHEYALKGDMVGSIDHAIERYLLSHYQGPVFISEFGYADGVKPSSTETVLEQMKTMNARYGADDRVCGTALYDIRRNGGVFDWSYMYRDLERALIEQNLPILPIRNFAGGIVEVPPTPEPEPLPEPTEFYNVIVASQYGCNMRAGATMDSDLRGYAAQGSKFRAQRQAQNSYIYLPDLGVFIYEPNTRAA